MKRNTPENFHSRYLKTESGCWEWDKINPQTRYGIFVIGKKRWKAHRFSWVIENGEIPCGLYVCHHCDNVRCVNPKHLFLGTQDDNMQDMKKKGRHKLSKSTKCFRGHTYTELSTGKAKNGQRYCKICKKEDRLRRKK